MYQSEEIIPQLKILTKQKYKRKWRRGFSEFYEMTDSRPFHVVIYNLLFIQKRFILALLLVCYAILPGIIQPIVIVVVHLLFMLQYGIFWMYMSPHKKFLHVYMDFFGLIVLASPLFVKEDKTSLGRLLTHVYAIAIIVAIIIGFLGFIPLVIYGVMKQYRKFILD